jgi:hypothetical protein
MYTSVRYYIIDCNSLLIIKSFNNIKPTNELIAMWLFHKVSCNISITQMQVGIILSDMSSLSGIVLPKRNRIIKPVKLTMQVKFRLQIFPYRYKNSWIRR